MRRSKICGVKISILHGMKTKMEIWSWVSSGGVFPLGDLQMTTGFIGLMTGIPKGLAGYMKISVLMILKLEDNNG